VNTLDHLAKQLENVQREKAEAEKQRAAYLRESDEWLDGLTDQIKDLEQAVEALLRAGWLPTSQEEAA
jgi:Tfp pilus assembly protein PilO